MTENNFAYRERQSDVLKALYKNYASFIIKYQTHIDRLYNDWVIDINGRNFVMQQLDAVIKQMNKAFNLNVKKIFSNDSDDTECTVYGELDNIAFIVDQITDSGKKYTNPFCDVHTALLKIIKLSSDR